MVAAKPKAGSDKGKNQNTETDNRDDGCSPASPAYRKSLVEEGRIKEPCDQRPNLLGVPLPKSTKGILCVEGTRNHPDSQKGETIDQGMVMDTIEHGE